ncbi:unnamed protein product [Fusarium graminearum]|nr:hypothetical protein HG531_004379 [Fusarium graminearum]CAF3458150.1 unnamed protein product [Fusarium graminearum]CAG1983459.1 unnamed protein product [Fusarium graminearum]VTO90027.1 unnamed protein product [Fusarium graminearum]
MDHLLDLVGEFMEVPANSLLGEDMARLDRMLMMDMVDMLMGVKMLVLMLVLSMMVLVYSMVMLAVMLVVAFANLLGAVRNGYANSSRNCAKRNERQGKSHLKKTSGTMK